MLILCQRIYDLFVQHMNHVLLNTDEAKVLRIALKDCVGKASRHQGTISERDRQLSRLFNVLLHAFSHNIAATLSLCLWAGAYRTAYLFIIRINPLDINLMFLLEIDRLIEMLEKPLFRYVFRGFTLLLELMLMIILTYPNLFISNSHLHVRMLECDKETNDEGSGTMLFQFLKCLLMVLPQSTCYRVLRDRLTSIARFRQSASLSTSSQTFGEKKVNNSSVDTKLFVSRIRDIRDWHCDASWKSIRQGSLEIQATAKEPSLDEGSDRRQWLGYQSKEEEQVAKKLLKERNNHRVEELKQEYQDFASIPGLFQKPNDLVETDQRDEHEPSSDIPTDKEDNQWIDFWSKGEP
jgi:Vacuolar protein 14 C-terminal Fig4p binding